MQILFINFSTDISRHIYKTTLPSQHLYDALFDMNLFLFAMALYRAGDVNPQL